MRHSSLFLAVLLSVSCATGYRQKGALGGFSDTKLSDDTYLVSYLANVYTDPHKVNLYLLYRCAELTVANGYDHFIRIEEKDQSTAANEPIAGGQASITRLAATIKMGKGPKPPDDTRAFDARELMKNVGPQIGK